MSSLGYKVPISHTCIVCLPQSAAKKTPLRCLRWHRWPKILSQLRRVDSTTNYKRPLSKQSPPVCHRGRRQLYASTSAVQATQIRGRGLWWNEINNNNFTAQNYDSNRRLSTKCIVIRCVKMACGVHAFSGYNEWPRLANSFIEWPCCSELAVGWRRSAHIECQRS